MDPFGDANLRQMAAENKEKKQYVQQYIIDYQYDEAHFKEYMTYINPEKGDNIDNWTLDELSACIRDYYVYCDGGAAQEDGQGQNEVGEG